MLPVVHPPMHRLLLLLTTHAMMDSMDVIQKAGNVMFQMTILMPGHVSAFGGTGGNNDMPLAEYPLVVQYAWQYRSLGDRRVVKTRQRLTRI